jgi:hypothetical protein
VTALILLGIVAIAVPGHSGVLTHRTRTTVVEPAGLPQAVGTAVRARLDGTPSGSKSPIGKSSSKPSASASGKPGATPSPAAPVRHGCAANPHVCGFPDSTNSGVPAGLKLLSVPGQISHGKGWHYDSRGWVEVNGNGAVLRGLYIPYNVDISASNVTIVDDKIVSTGNGFGVSLRHTSNVTIAHSSIFSPYASGSNRLQVGIKDVYSDSSKTTVEYDNIYHASTGVQLSEGLIANTYIHDPGYMSGDHIDGIASDAGDSSGLTIEHNTVLNAQAQTTAVGLFEDFGPQFDCLVEDNLLAGGGYVVYAGANPGGARPSNIVVINNRFSRIYYRNGGYYGPATDVAAGVSGNVWRGNIWDDNAKPVNW